MLSRLLLVACLLSGACAPAPDLDPVATTSGAVSVTLNPPTGWETHALHLFVGIYPGDGKQYITYYRADTGACSSTVAGTTSTAWSNDFFVNMGSQGDIITVPKAGDFAYVPCTGAGFSVTAPVHTGTQLTVNGLGGNDDMTCGGTGAIICSGGDGDDFMRSYVADAFMTGGPGADYMISYVNNQYAIMVGNDGADCLEYAIGGSNSIPYLDCGPGADLYVGNYQGISNACETRVSSCD